MKYDEFRVKWARAPMAIAHLLFIRKGHDGAVRMLAQLSHLGSEIEKIKNIFGLNGI
jgi:hypothetical protein